MFIYLYVCVDKKYVLGTKFHIHSISAITFTSLSGSTLDNSKLKAEIIPTASLTSSQIICSAKLRPRVERTKRRG